MNNPEQCYNGNPYVKRDGVDQEYTEWELEEYVKCSEDPEYFIENYVKVISLKKGLTEFKLYGYQKKMVSHFNKNRFSIVLACRQSGKSVTSVAWLLWFILFHADKKVGILANKGATAREMLSRLLLMLENIPFFLQPGCKILNKGSIVFSNNSSIIAAATSASSIRGLSLNCVGENTKICVEDDRGIFYCEISNLINNEMQGKFIKKDHYLIYQTTNLVNGKIYIGFHSTNRVDDGYLGSGKLLKSAIAKYGPDKFKREILFDFATQDEAEQKERELVNAAFIAREDTYNLTCGGNITILHGAANGFFHKSHTPQTRAALSKQKLGNNNEKLHLNIFNGDKVIGRFLTIVEEIEKHFPELKGKTYNETKRNVLLACGNDESPLNFKDVKKQNTCVELFNKDLLRDRAKEKIARYAALSKKLTGVKKHSGFGELISVALKGKSKSPAHVNKINRNPEKIRKTAEKHRGMQRSQATRDRMSAAAKKRPCNNRGKKYYINPNDTQQRGYFLEAPLGWINKTKV